MSTGRALEVTNELVRLAIRSGADVEIVHTDVPDTAEEFQTVSGQGCEHIPRSDAAIVVDQFGRRPAHRHRELHPGR